MSIIARFAPSRNQRCSKLSHADKSTIVRAWVYRECFLRSRANGLKVLAPILSRSVQDFGDSMAAFKQGRKIADNERSFPREMHIAFSSRLLAMGNFDYTTCDMKKQSSTSHQEQTAEGLTLTLAWPKNANTVHQSLSLRDSLAANCITADPALPTP